MSYYKKGDIWLPTEFKERRERYLENQKLFEGGHQGVFKKVQEELEKSQLTEQDKKDREALTYVVINYCGLVSKLSADMLFGENPSFDAGQDNTQAQEAIDGFINDFNLKTKFYESALGNSYRGDSAFKVRWAKLNPTDEERQVIIEPQNPYYLFADTAPDNIQRVIRYIVAWKYSYQNASYLRLEVHERGMIYNYCYRVEGAEVVEEVGIDFLYENGLIENRIEEEQETGVDAFLIRHIPNWRTDTKLWGYSDYLDIKTLQDEANNRLSQIARILDKHADPKMRGPEQAMSIDDEGNRHIEVSGSRYFPYEKDGAKPEYLTWEAKLDSAFKEIDKMLDMMFLVTETSPASFGMDKGGVAESGRALKFKLMRTIAKTSRKKRYYDEAIKAILHSAQKLQVQKGEGEYEPVRPSSNWRDGLPDDELETAERTATLERAKAVSTRKKVEMNHPNWSEEEIQKEINRIEQEKEEEQQGSMTL